MQPKQIKPFKIGIISEGRFQPLGESIEDIMLEQEELIEITNLEDSEPRFLNNSRSFECEFEIGGGIFDKLRSFALRTEINNWRKLHGLPMVRKRSFRKVYRLRPFYFFAVLEQDFQNRVEKAEKSTDKMSMRLLKPSGSICIDTEKMGYVNE